MAEHARTGADVTGDATGLEVAIVGMAGRFPGADDIAAFWRNLRNGVEAISFFTHEELIEAGEDPAVLDHPGFVAAGGFLRGADELDAPLFGLSPRDAEVMDPQHRVLLECAWAALEHAGYDPARAEGPVGVFAGSGHNRYVRQVETAPGLVRAVGGLRASLWNDKDQLAAGISYRLDLRGPAVAVQTACSTSLVAVHLACQSLINGECDLALAGGVAISVPLRGGYVYTPEGIGSPDGHCRAFDAEARGTVGGHGAGLVVLKRLDAAIADGDTIHAVIRGSAINNDGAQKVGYTAPSVTGQAGVISEAIGVAGVDASTIQYVEAHGSGTSLGDAIELRALTQVMARAGDGHRCAIGSVKTGIGHLDSAAGVAGLIKTVLALESGEIPPSLHCTTPHREIEASGGRLFVNTALRPWERNGTPRRAGVSSFGIGGTNAHAILEEAPPREPSGPSRASQLLVVSARTPTALAAAAERLAVHLEDAAEPLADVAFTLQLGRRELGHRLAVVCADAAEGASRLRAAAASAASAVPRTERPVAFMFPGVGTHYPEMGRGLYEAEPAYREAVDACCEILRPVLGCDLREVLFPGGGREAPAEAGGWDLRRLVGTPAAAGGGEGTPLDDTRFAQPATFVTEYALARLWESWGVRPRAVVGHSLGEYVAACIAGVLRLEDALRLVALRAQLIDALPEGAMLAVPMEEEALRRLLPPELDVAAVNTAGSCVVSGPPAAVAELEAALAAREVVSRRLTTRHAFHSRAMERVAEALERTVAEFELKAPEIPFVSCVSGSWLSDADARSPAYWARHLCRTVRFADAVDTLTAEPGWVLLEVGPGQTLGAWALQHRSAAPPGGRTILSSMRHRHNRVPDLRFVLETLGGLWASGVSVSWKTFAAGERRHRVPLPVYPFERTRHWVDSPRQRDAREGAAPSHPNEATPMQTLPATPGPAAPSTARRRVILDRLRALTSEMTGIDEREVDVGTDFFQAGFDSLLLLQAIQAIEKRIGVRVSLVELLEDITSLGALAEHIDAALPPEVELEGTPVPGIAPAPAPEPAPAGAAVPAPPAFYPTPLRPATPTYPDGNGGEEGSALERLVAQQLRFLSEQNAQQLHLMAQQVAALGGGGVPAAPPETQPREVPRSPRAKIQPETFVAYRPLNTEAPKGMTPDQKAYLDDFVARYVARTRGSKAHQARFHEALADTRVTAKFRRAWKEILYPIAGERARGSRIWDPDGNEYVDIGMAYGCSLFGHAPDFVTRAIQEQVERGYGLGPQSMLAGRAAELVCELGGNERAIFCNSGTEAVMGAIRAARAYTGRSRIVYFAGSYHGWADAVLGRMLSVGDRREVRASAPGVPELPLGDVMMLDFDEPASLEWLAEHAHDVALVLVEPVQSRRPDLQPFAFLRELRRITRESGALLLFDELITGFRMGAGGAGAFFGVDPDLVTYGKIVAGGLPMGVIAGTREAMSVFDGGLWRYGDDSFPTAQRTVFAGAYFKHPLSMGVACSILEEIRRRGQPMYDELDGRTTRLVERINAFFEAERYPITAAHFASCFRFFFGPELRSPELFDHHLIHEGIYVIPETGTFFLSTAHDDDDVEKVFQAIRASAEAMRRGGFIPDAAAVPPPAERVPARIGEWEPAPTGAAAGAAGVRALPLTAGQRQLWIESQMGEDANRAYTESTSIRLRGPLDVEALRRALQALVDRHDTLRITLAPDGETQLVHPSLAVEVPFEDFRGVPAEARDAEVEGWVSRTVQHPFDLVNGPLVRFALAATGDGEHLLLFDSHHVVLDGWSFGVLWKELDLLYTAARDGRSADLPPVPGHAAQVAAQVEAVAANGAAAEFWKAQFADGVPVLDLPTDRPRPPVRGYRGGRVTREAGGELVDRLAEAGRPHGFTLFNTIFSACFLWLSRLSGDEDLVVGTPAAGQAGSAEARALLGYGINILPVRARVRPESPFVEHARRVRRALLAGLEHQNFSLPRLVESLLRSRDPGRPPLFSVLVNLDRAREEGSLGGLRAGFQDNFGGGAKVDLVLGLTERADRLSLFCDYDADLFDRATVERWLAALEHLLEQVAADPTVPLERLALLGGAERRRVLEEWSRAGTEPSPPRCVHELFETQAERTPDAVAVVFGDESLTYRELNQRSNRLARYLRRRGVTSGARVGTCLERGPEMVIALLGVLKGGAGYVPLDPGYPADRLAGMLADAGVEVLVTQQALLDRFPGVSGAIALDREAAEVAGEDASDLGLPLSPDHPCYVIYTSGSTGRPKGTEVPHRAIPGFFPAVGRGGPGTETVTLQYSSTSWDALTLELWPPLLSGGTCVLYAGTAPSPEALGETVRRHGVNTLWLTSAYFNTLVDTAPGALEGVRRVMVGGEAVSAAHVRAAQRRHAGLEVVNGYGPSECTVFCTAHEVGPLGDEVSSIPIGRPVGDRRVYVLDAWLHPVPAGVPGEIYVGGRAVPHGYLGRARLTAEALVPDPFGEPGARLYRTGDRARWRADGTLDFLGRLDGQVKVRGFRVEPGEIESVLRRAPGVAECAVVVREDAPGDRRLVAYVVPEGAEPRPEDADVEALRSHLLRTLPGFMVPAAVVALDRMPLTPHGKLDRDRLPAPRYEAASDRYAAPGTPLEETLAAVWREVLGVERVGRNDGFFELGGHSLLVPRLQTRLREVLGRTLPLVDLFRFPTVAFLAEHLAADPESGTGPGRGTARAAKRRSVAASRAGGGGGAAAELTDMGADR